MNFNLHVIIMTIAGISMNSLTFTLSKTLTAKEFGKMKNTNETVACGCPNTGKAVCGSDNATYPNMCQLECAKRANKTDLRSVPFKECEGISKVKNMVAEKNVTLRSTKGKPVKKKNLVSSKKLQKANLNKQSLTKIQPMNKTHKSNLSMNKTNKVNTTVNKQSYNIKQNLTTPMKNINKGAHKRNQLLIKQTAQSKGKINENVGAKKNNFQVKKQENNKSIVKENLKNPNKAKSIMNVVAVPEVINKEKKLYLRNKSINDIMQILHSPVKYINNRKIIKSLIEDEPNNVDPELLRNIKAVKKHINRLKKIVTTKRPKSNKSYKIRNPYLIFGKRFHYISKVYKDDDLNSNKKNNHYHKRNFRLNNMLTDSDTNKKNYYLNRNFMHHNIMNDFDTNNKNHYYPNRNFMHHNIMNDFDTNNKNNYYQNGNFMHHNMMTDFDINKRNYYLNRNFTHNNMMTDFDRNKRNYYLTRNFMQNMMTDFDTNNKNNFYLNRNFMHNNMNNMRHAKVLNDYPFLNQYIYRQVHESPYRPFSPYESIINRMEPHGTAWYKYGNSFHGTGYVRHYPYE